MRTEARTSRTGRVAPGRRLTRACRVSAQRAAAAAARRGPGAVGRGVRARVGVGARPTDGAGGGGGRGAARAARDVAAGLCRAARRGGARQRDGRAICTPPPPPSAPCCRGLRSSPRLAPKGSGLRLSTTRHEVVVLEDDIELSPYWLLWCHRAAVAFGLPGSDASQLARGVVSTAAPPRRLTLNNSPHPRAHPTPNPTQPGGHLSVHAAPGRGLVRAAPAPMVRPKLAPPALAPHTRPAPPPLLYARATDGRPGPRRSTWRRPRTSCSCRHRGARSTFRRRCAASRPSTRSASPHRSSPLSKRPRAAGRRASRW